VETQWTSMTLFTSLHRFAASISITRIASGMIHGSFHRTPGYTRPGGRRVRNGAPNPGLVPSVQRVFVPVSTTINYFRSRKIELGVFGPPINRARHDVVTLGDGDCRQTPARPIVSAGGLSDADRLFERGKPSKDVSNDVDHLRSVCPCQDDKPQIPLQTGS
jgi:hypothetical protein